MLQVQAFPMYALTATLTRATAAQPSSALQMTQGCVWRCCLSLQQVRPSWIIGFEHRQPVCLMETARGSLQCQCCLAEVIASCLAVSAPAFPVSPWEQVCFDR